MKKFLALILSLVIVLSLCACGADPAENAGTPSDPAAENTGSADSTDTPTDPAGKQEDVSYVGTWKVIPPDENKFPPLILVLNEDGTAGLGTNPEKLQERIWYECEEEDAKEGQMELSREDNKGYGDHFYITEDGTLYLEMNVKVEDRVYDHVYFERQ